MKNGRVIVTVKPNWMRPRATTRTQKTTETETEAERMNWAEEFIILDCFNPILYQLPVRSNGSAAEGSSLLLLILALLQSILNPNNCFGGQRRTIRKIKNE